MAVKTITEILESVNNVVGESADDETLAFIEDITDTLKDYDTRVQGDGVDWKKKYEENDAEWRTRYKDRFFGGDTQQREQEIIDDFNKKEEEEEKVLKTFEDLFTTEV